MRSTTTLSIAAAMALVLTACGGGDDDADSSSDGELVIAGDGGADGELVIADDAAADETISTDDSSGTSQQTDEEQALAFAQCMRDEGVDFPDPTTNADGSIDFFGGAGAGGAGFDPNDTAVQDAFEVCGSLLEGASFLPNGGDGFDAETQDTFLEFTQCLRDNGLDVDDPDFSNFGDGDGGFGGGGGGGGLFGGDFDPNDPAAQDAIEACQGLFAGGPFGGGGGN